MASQLAQTIVRDVLLAVGVRANQADIAVAMHNADVELQEVREVVKLVAHPKFDADSGKLRYYLTLEDVERARELMKRLEVK